MKLSASKRSAYWKSRSRLTTYTRLNVKRKFSVLGKIQELTFSTKIHVRGYLLPNYLPLGSPNCENTPLDVIVSDSL